MKDLPLPIQNFLHILMEEKRSPGYLLVNEVNNLIDYGGNLTFYGLLGLQKDSDVDQQVPFLMGLLPLDTNDLYLSYVHTGRDSFADVYLFRSEQGTWILLLDATQAAHEQRNMQQRAHELSLKLSDVKREEETIFKAHSLLEERLTKQIAELLQDNSQLRQELKEHQKNEERNELLQTITMEVAASIDLSAALEVVLRRTCERTGWIFAQAWIPYVKEESILISSPAQFSLHSGIGKYNFIPTATITSSNGLRGRVWASKQLERVQDITRDSDFLNAKFNPEGELKAGLVVPILFGKKIVALIEFFSPAIQQDDELHIEMIAEIAARISSLIELKRAEEALICKNEQLIDIACRLIQLQEKQQVTKIDRDAQQSLHVLNSSILKHNTLIFALASFCDDFARDHGTTVSIDAPMQTASLTAETALCLYCIAEEALRSVAKCSDVESIKISLVESGKGMELIIQHMGKVLDSETAWPGDSLSLNRIEEYLRLRGGDLSVTLHNDIWMELRAYIPC